MNIIHCTETVQKLHHHIFWLGISSFECEQILSVVATLECPNVPGHFTMYNTVKPYDVIRGEKRGINYVITKDLLPLAAAGDTNKDNVIDIMDALTVQAYWGTSNPSADFNFDKIVDAKDMNYVVKNFGLKNTTVSNAPNAKKTYKGATLDSVLTKLGLK